MARPPPNNHSGSAGSGWQLPSNGAVQLSSNGGIPSSYACDSFTSPRILRDLGSNHQNDGAQRTGLNSKYESLDLPENLSYPRLQNGRDVIVPHTDPRRICFQPEVDREVYQLLLDRRWKCEPYMTYRNGQGKDVDNQKDLQKWPPQMEEVFFRALIYHEPCGRKKYRTGPRGGRPLPRYLIEKKNRLLGRNERIALFIDDWFGNVDDEAEKDKRKRISSHLQVLKNYFKYERDKNVMWFLGAGKSPRPPFETRWGSSIRGSLTYPTFDRDTGTCPSYQNIQSSHHASLPQAPNVLASQAAKTPATILEPYQFRVYMQKCQCEILGHVCEKPSHDCKTEEVHSIPAWQQGTRLAATVLDESHFWHLQRHGETTLNCDMFYAETSLDLELNTSGGSRFSIAIENVLVAGVELNRGEQWQCRTRIFERDTLKDILDDAEASNHDTHQVEPDKEDPRLLSISVRSEFWAVKFGNLSERLRNARNASAAAAAERNKDASPTVAGAIPAKDIYNKIEEEIRNEIRHITAVQEIFIKTGRHGQGRKRVMVLYWNFRKTKKDEIGSTTWRTLIPPRAHTQQTSREMDMIMRDVGLDALANDNLALGSNDLTVVDDHSASLMMSGSHSAMQSQPQPHHEIDMLSSANLGFDPALYDFELLTGGQQLGSHTDQHSVVSKVHSLANAGDQHAAFISQPLQYAGGVSFGMPMSFGIEVGGLTTPPGSAGGESMHGYEQSTVVEEEDRMLLQKQQQQLRDLRGMMTQRTGSQMVPNDYIQTFSMSTYSPPSHTGSQHGNHTQTTHTQVQNTGYPHYDQQEHLQCHPCSHRQHLAEQYHHHQQQQQQQQHQQQQQQQLQIQRHYLSPFDALFAAEHDWNSRSQIHQRHVYTTPAYAQQRQHQAEVTAGAVMEATDDDDAEDDVVVVNGVEDRGDEDWEKARQAVYDREQDWEEVHGPRLFPSVLEG